MSLRNMARQSEDVSLLAARPPGVRLPDSGRALSCSKSQLREPLVAPALCPSSGTAELAVGHSRWDWKAQSLLCIQN